MKRPLVCFALAALIPTGCNSHSPSLVRAGCPQFPPAHFDEKGGAYGSTSFGAMPQHSRPVHHVEIPEGHIGDVRIALERGACFGTCPIYRVELRGNGEVLFHGGEFVTFPGDHQTRVSPFAIQCLLDDFRVADFWSLDGQYVAPVTDLPTYTISLTIGGKTKILTDYAGQAVGMPANVTALERAVDEVAETDSWVSGDAKTISLLETEHFDFHSRKAADLLANAAQDAPDAVVIGLLEHGVPIDGLTNKGDSDERMTAIEAAAMNGRLALVRRLIEAGAFSKGGRALISATLRASVASQDAGLVAEILKYHPDVNSTDKHGDTALALVFTGAHPHEGDKGVPDDDPAIIRLLGKAGANPNPPNSEHEDLLDLAYSKEQKDALLAIGAKRHGQPPSK